MLRVIRAFPELEQSLEIHRRVDAKALPGGGQGSGSVPQVELFLFGDDGEDVCRALWRTGPPGFGAFQGLVEFAGCLVETDEDFPERAVLLHVADNELFELG